MDKRETQNMTEAVLHVPDFSGRLNYDTLNSFCMRLDEVLSPHFVERLRAKEGQEVLGRIVVYTRGIQDISTKERKGMYVVNLTSFESKNEGPEVIYLRNVREAMYELRRQWGMAYNILSDKITEMRLRNCEERFNMEADRLVQP